MGTAGTGKSYLIKALQQSLTTSLLTTATTGVAAFNINGQTIHSLLKLPISESQKKELSGGSLGELQDKLKGKHTIIIDEISMCKQEEFAWIEKRLRQISGKSTLFGEFNVICVGDFAQLPPVRSVPIYQNNDEKHNSHSPHGYLMYTQFQDVVLLQSIKRQDGMY